MVIKATVITVLFAEVYVNVFFVIRCLHSAMSLTLVKESHFIRIFIIINIIIIPLCATALFLDGLL